MEIQLWREILSPYEQAVTELVEKFQHLSLEHRERGLYSPIEQVTGRVKSITSILEKMKRKKIPFEEMEEQVEDIAGIRIICQFVEDIQRVSDLSPVVLTWKSNVLKIILHTRKRAAIAVTIWSFIITWRR